MTALLLLAALAQSPGDIAWLAPRADGKPLAVTLAAVDLEAWHDSLKFALADDDLGVIEMKREGRLFDVRRDVEVKVIKAYRDLGTPRLYPVEVRVRSGPLVNRRVVVDSTDLSAERPNTTPD